jgi:hypothetical protein
MYEASTKNFREELTLVGTGPVVPARKGFSPGLPTGTTEAGLKA